jgi:hypothetical protein
MSVIIDGTAGITTPGLTNTGTETVVNLTTTGNTTLGDATTDTLAVGVTGIVKDASGNVGIGTSSPTSKLVVSGGSLATSGIAFNVASVLTTGKAGTYDAGTLSAIHSYSDNASMEMSAGTSANYVSAISCTGTAATNYSATIRFTTYSAERMRIDSSGNVGIGTTNPSRSKLVIGATTSQISLTDADGSSNIIDITRIAGPGLSFSSNGSEKMRISSGGNLGILGTATDATVYVQNTGSGPSCPSVAILGQPQAAFYVRRQSTSDTNTNATFCFGVDDTAGGNGQPTLIVGLNTSGVGALPRNVTNGVRLTYNATSWSAGSDIRLKDVVSYITDGLSVIDQINPIKFTWKHDENKVPCVGVIAQDVQSVIPEAVDIIDNKSGHLGVRYTELIPHLISAVKELKSIIDTQASTITSLTARITALETK